MHDALLSTMAGMPAEISVDLPETLTLHVFSAFLCAAVAASKGRSAIAWFVIGLLTGCCPAFLILIFLSDVKSPEALAAEAAAAENAEIAAAAPPPPPQSPLPPTEAPQWYYEEAEEAAGPVSRASLIALMRAGAVTGSTLVWRQGMDDWAPLDDVDELGDPA